MKILIVDDSKMLVHFLKMLLNSLGYDDFHGVNSVAEAKKALLSDKYDLVFSDMHMPDESGLDLVKFIKGVPSLANQDVIMITSDTDASLLTDAVKAGIYAFIIKPVEIETLYSKMLSLSEVRGLQAPVIPTEQEQSEESSEEVVLSRNVDIDDPILFRIVDKWGSLPDNIKNGIIKLIESVQ
ncbi:response regulator [bacterium]|nr:response regulator [bacterium]